MRSTAKTRQPPPPQLQTSQPCSHSSQRPPRTGTASEDGLTTHQHSQATLPHFTNFIRPRSRLQLESRALYRRPKDLRLQTIAPCPMKSLPTISLLTRQALGSGSWQQCTIISRCRSIYFTLSWLGVRPPPSLAVACEASMHHKLNLLPVCAYLQVIRSVLGLQSNL